MKLLKLLVFALLLLLLLKLVASSLESDHKLPLVSEYFKLYSIGLYIGMTKPNVSASTVVVPSIFVIHLVNDLQTLKC